MNNLSNNLKKIRKDNNLSQETLAEKLGVSRQAISKWESGAAYPEMEKLVQICSEFNLNIDDLLNKDIREVKGEEISKNNINKYMEDFLNFITDTVNLFSNMSFKTKVKCLVEQLIIFSILVIIFGIIGSIGASIFGGLFNFLPRKIYYGFFDAFKGIYFIFALIACSVIIVHIFKTRYLDYFKVIKNNKADENDSKDIITNKDNRIEIREDKIIIRDPKHSEYKFINGILKLILLFIKFITLMITFCFCGFVFLIFVLFTLSFLFIKTGVLFFGLITSFISLGIITIVVVLFLFNFIFDRKNDKKKMIWSFILAIVMFGIGCGLFFIGSLKFDFIDEADLSSMKKDSYTYQMKDTLVILNDDVEYIEMDISDVVVEYNVNEMYDVKFAIMKSYDFDIIHYWTYCPNFMKNARYVISKINNNKVVNIDNSIVNVKVYASHDNLEIIKNNNIKYQEKSNTIDGYIDRINELENEVSEKDFKISEFENEILEKDSIINELENMIEE